MKPIDVKIYYEGSGCYRATPVWAGVDRPESWSMGCPSKEIAFRFARAYMAGKGYSNPQIKTDVNGKTFVSEFCQIRGRALNADLKRLGF